MRFIIKNSIGKALLVPLNKLTPFFKANFLGQGICLRTTKKTNFRSFHLLKSMTFVKQDSQTNSKRESKVFKLIELGLEPTS